MNIDINSIGEQFTNLDPDNIGNWPVFVKSLIILVICSAVLGAGYYFDTQEQQAELNQVASEESGLWASLEKKQKKAANLDAYKAQMKEMEESFGTMLRQLPSKNEVADLLVDITQTGLASGLEFELFKPKKESRKEFYAVLPIDIDVTGSYSSIGEFISGIAALPRIVTVHDIKLSAEKKRSGSGTNQLKMKATAKTYRYLDDEEIAAAGAKKKKSRRTRR